MKTLFIYPNLNCQVGFNYGISFLSSVLKTHGHKTHLLNINENLGFGLDLDRIRREIEAFDPDLIGFSVVSNQYQNALKIAQSIKTYRNVPIICGGVHATFAPQEVITAGPFDYICIGEGEYALLDLADSLEKGSDTSTIPNIWVRKDGEILRNRVRPFVDLTELPFKDYSIFPMQEMIDARDGWVGVMASRGCPFQCNYCFNHQMVGLYKKDLGVSEKDLNYLRHHPIALMIEELRYLQNQYRNIEVFIFDDDLFTVRKDYLRAFTKAYRQNFSIPFVVNAHPMVFDAETAFCLKEAGCNMVKFGLESGSERIRSKILGRNMSDSQIVDSFRIAHQHGLKTSAFVMIGLPYEEREDLFKTIDLLAHINPNRIRWSVFFPYPGTRAYDISVKGGFINFEKLKALSNFTDESALDFGEENNLFLRKVKKIFPWFVNARASFPSSSFYRLLAKGIEEMNQKEWEIMEEDLIEIDKALSSGYEKTGKGHYAIRYNEFMAERVDGIG